MRKLYYSNLAAEPTSLARRMWSQYGDVYAFIAQKKSDGKLYVYDSPMCYNKPFAGPFKSLRLALVALELLS